jgi:hypothetical protein
VPPRRYRRAAGVGWTLGCALLLALAYALLAHETGENGKASPAPASGEIERLFAERRSGEVVEAGGSVLQVLQDDREGSRHQRFILRLRSGHTVLVSHNIDLAPRVPRLERGDEVRFRGQYEWNERGGVIHWTHHDPDGRRPGGWLRHDGATYR